MDRTGSGMGKEKKRMDKTGSGQGKEKKRMDRTVRERVMREG